MCPCGAVGLDGGIGPSNRVLGKMSDMEERSMYRASVAGKKLWLPHSVIEERFNALVRVETKPHPPAVADGTTVDSPT